MQATVETGFGEHDCIESRRAAFKDHHRHNLWKNVAISNSLALNESCVLVCCDEGGGMPSQCGEMLTRKQDFLHGFILPLTALAYPLVVGTMVVGEEWEKELQQELQDYELVGGEGDDDNLGDNDELEREIMQQIEREAGSLS
ncbi:hypothetical protein RRG08_033641 [Elysia crispata]|uniref:Uncharacterized protein n=1 Tax=Elysia crispata TaxID=231223 RepID=A0AAE0XQR8_9GAST|nr:hypothetical protein RRG08_033641 [Elysia crispata]